MRSSVPFGNGLALVQKLLSSLGPDFIFLCIRKKHSCISPTLNGLFNTPALLTPEVWVFHTSSNSVTPAGRPSVPFSSDIVHLEVASDLTGLLVPSHKTVPTSDASLSRRLSPVL